MACLVKKIIKHCDDVNAIYRLAEFIAVSRVLKGGVGYVYTPPLLFGGDKDNPVTGFMNDTISDGAGTLSLVPVASRVKSH